ncbi:SDR family oxidoreductase [Micromonospora peucetia]|uniref:NADP-dependent 3-hydroxy acid dehydrogenase YdfG n=1 Tax=Micromonospora peucetia TaxID=47871 RepID=A0A1C6VUG0_9ACTN|nr:SDR family oxidoreductase [Micromonospora peucetia]MCX4388132.1 SDR family oxidoreductase [Micromonospora peucetia]WSA31188.1 SDR family oxidoreductase [Micromonospora peucetia]SCL69953.1 NADP-dependent 3-hydroxy acid dehydrogenase YdfG [Micromonospora peucetia]
MSDPRTGPIPTVLPGSGGRPPVSRPDEGAGLLAGRVVLVTGAANGLGAAYARGIAAAGAHVVAVDVDEKGLERLSGQLAAVGGRGSSRVADVADWATAHDLVRDCLAEHGQLDGLVNNAGVFAMAHAGTESEAMARRMLEVNVLGTIAWGNAAIAAMRTQGHGVLVNVTSGEQMGRAETAVYGATKAAIATLTYAWAAELAEAGIRVNAISPNAQTQMAEVLEQFRGAPSGQNAGIAPEANVPLLLYLLSDLSVELTGQVLRSNGPELMLTTHPALVDPVLRHAAWTPERIAEAVTARLRPYLAPLGVRRVRIEYLD